MERVLTSADDRPLRGFTFGGRLTGLLTDPIVQCVIFILIASAIFVALPGIDLWFSGLFAGPNRTGFPVGGLTAFIFLRNVNRALTAIIPTVLVIGVIAKLVRPDRRSLVPPAKAAFLLVTLAVASGIVANLIFKDHWGRPRPVNVDVFGGMFPFVPAWRVSDYCAANCSFVSGEGSSAMWLLGLAVLLPAVWRPTALKVLFAFVVLVSLNRIAFGGHFLSDVLLAWGFTLLIMAIAYRYMIERPLLWFDNDRMEADLTRWGVAIRKRLGFPTPGFEEAIALEAPALVTPPPHDLRDIDEATPSDAPGSAAEDEPDTRSDFDEPSETPADAIMPVEGPPPAAEDGPRPAAPPPPDDEDDAERRMPPER
jgi:lipid A 4'-phosphatase